MELSRPPRWLKQRSSVKLIGATAFVAAFTEGFIYATVVPVLPFSLVERMGIPEGDVQYWQSLLLMVFGITMTCSAPIAGWVADRTSTRQRPLLFGLGLAYGATLLFCFAISPAMLVLARCFQGFASSILFTAGLALIADSVSVDEVGSWMGFVLSGMNFGALVGPFIAGALYESIGYYAVFAAVIAVLVIDTVLRLIMIEKGVAAQWLSEIKTSDPISNQEAQISQDSPNDNHDAKSTVTATTVASPDLSSPSSLSSTESSPLLHKEPTTLTQPKKNSWFARAFPRMAVLVSSPRLMTAVYGCFTHTTLIASFDAILPLFVNRAFGWGSAGAGSIFLAITIPSLLGPVVGALSDRYGTKKIALVGFGITGPFLALLGLVLGGELAYRILLVVLLVLTSIGLNTLLSPLAADMFFEVEILAAKNPSVFGKKGAFAQAYSLFDSALGLATFVGPAWAGFVYEQTSWSVCMLTLAGLCVVAAVPVKIYTGGKGGRREGDANEG